jgi:hypothetical protein
LRRKRFLNHQYSRLLHRMLSRQTVPTLLSQLQSQRRPLVSSQMVMFPEHHHHRKKSAQLLLHQSQQKHNHHRLSALLQLHHSHHHGHVDPGHDDSSGLVYCSDLATLDLSTMHLSATTSTTFSPNMYPLVRVLYHTLRSENSGVDSLTTGHVAECTLKSVGRRRLQFLTIADLRLVPLNPRRARRVVTTAARLQQEPARTLLHHLLGVQTRHQPLVLV